MPTVRTSRPGSSAGSSLTNGNVRVPSNGAAGVGDRRIVPTLDFTAQTQQLPPDALRQTLQLSVTQFYRGLGELKGNLAGIIAGLPQQFLPPRLIGTMLQPNGSAAPRLHVEVVLPGSAGPAGVVPVATTDEAGAFVIPLPGGIGLGPKDVVSLNVRGADGTQIIPLTPGQIGAHGILGAVTLPGALAPLPVSILASLEAMFPAPQPSSAIVSPTKAPNQLPSVSLGAEYEADDICSQILNSSAAEDRFPYGVFFRLVEPRASILNKVIRFPWGRDGNAGKATFTIADRNAQWSGGGAGGGVVDFVDRVPVDQPLSVDGMRDQLIGVGNGTVVNGAETVPMAGTLGLGYVLRQAQKWTPRGLTLGDLVYSLPLAPGEQERVAIFERRDVTSVREAETLDVVEQQSFQQQQDTSAQATFDQSFSEMARGGSRFSSSASSDSGGFNILIASGGGGSSQSQGQTSSWMEGQRNVSSRAAEDTHASVERTAAAHRSAQRTSMRLASASESMDVTTKVITNHNHLRALTLQYWEVRRMWEVSTSIDGVDLVCLVPLEVVRFLPVGEGLTLDDQSFVATRQQVLARYSQLIKHADILQEAMPRQYQHGLTVLREFCADPRATVQDPNNAAAEDVVTFTVTGSFLPMEDIYVSAVTKRGTRVGPVRMTGVIDPLPGAATDPSKAFASEGELFSYCRSRRNGLTGYTLEGMLALPPSLARNDIVGFEISRRYHPFDYDFVSPSIKSASLVNNLAPFDPARVTIGPITIDAAGDRSVHYAPERMEQELGGPFIWNFNAAVPAANGGTESFATNYLPYGSGVELPPGSLPIPSLQLAPMLRYSDVLQIEKTLHHVVTNLMTYSKAVWSSLTPEERAVMLEGFTIGVPNGGIADGSQEVPLLNCVTNTVLGYFGNAMIMPFVIPQVVADDSGVTNASIQDALTAFHKVGFDPPKSVITLPTRGVLGEAVLGHCAAGEKIDVTRFWNWADSPADTAPNIADVSVPTNSPSLTTGASAPNALTGMAPLITNFNNAPPIPVDTSLMNSLVAAGAGQKDFTGLTNADQLAGLIKQNITTAESARADALKRATELQSQAMTEIGNYFGAKGGEAYAANYRPAGSQGGSNTATPSGTATGQTKPAGAGTAKPGTKPGGTGAGTGGTGTGTGTGTGGSSGSGGSTPPVNP